jgi:EpsI family protein
VLARTYVNRKGQRVMLSIAYGSDQGSEATAVHRPEFCYSAQGFKVDAVGSGSVALDDRSVPTRWLIGQLGPRHEPISYWVTLDESATLPGLGRKLTQMAYGMAGQIPDGMLVRVSNIAAPGNDEASFALHKAFIQELKDAVPAGVRSRYFGQ